MRYAFDYSGLARSFPVAAIEVKELSQHDGDDSENVTTFAPYKNSSRLCHFVLIGVTEGFIIGAL